MSTNGWSGGYNVETDYVWDYYPEMDPQRVRLALLRAGWAVPEIRTACELGFGHGTSLVVHAAAGGADWWGNDFMPGQVADALDLARRGGVALSASDESFAEFAARDDLPTFDYVALHGVWSWVSAADREAIVAFLRRRLAPGGVVYLSFNVRAGWAPHLPLQSLLKQFVDRVAPRGAAVGAKLDAGFDFVERLASVPGKGTAITAALLGRSLETFRAMDRRYLAHEFLHDGWQAFDFCEVARDLTAAKLDWAGSANLLDTVDAVSLSAEQSAFLATIADPVAAQSARDALTAQMFRRDLFLRGARRMSPSRRMEAIRTLRVVLMRPPGMVFGKIAGANGSGALDKTLFLALIDRLADLESHGVGALIDAVAPDGDGPEKVFEAICILSTLLDLALVQPEAAVEAARPRTMALNAALLDANGEGSEISVLASPVTGGGVACDTTERLFLEAHARGVRSAQELAERAWSILSACRPMSQIEGDDVNEDNAALAAVIERAEAFLGSRLTQLRALGLVDRP